MITISASTILLILLAVLLGALLTLGGVVLGALAVFRTKREPHESLFKFGLEKGDAFVQDDIEEDGSGILERIAKGRNKGEKADHSGMRERFAQMENDFASSAVGKAHQRFREQQTDQATG